MQRLEVEVGKLMSQCLELVGAVLPGTKLQEHSGSEKAWVYSTVDFAEEEQKMETFCLRFGSLESAEAPCAPAEAALF